MNASHPLAPLASAEAALVASIDAAAARLDAVGRSPLDAALERLRNAAHAASARLQEAGSLVASIAGDVLEHVLSVTAEVEGAVMGFPATATAQARTAPGYTYTEPAVEPAVPHELPSPDVLARLPFLFAGQRPPEPEPAPAGPQTPRERYPAAASPPDGPTLFDAAGNAGDPTDVLLGGKAIAYAPGVPVALPGGSGDGGAGHAVASPQRKRRGR